MYETKTTLGMLGVMAVVLAPLALSAGSLNPPPVQRRAERPQAQAGQDNSISWMQKVVFLPAGSNTVKFDFGCDSEPYDFLKLYVNYSQLWSISGHNRRGHRQIPICTNGGICILRFVYAKNGAKSEGSDTAWVDNVLISTGSYGRALTARFNELHDSVPIGWSGSGTSGGFRVSPHDQARSASRPAAHAFLGPVDQDSVSYMQRTIKWPLPQDNSLSFSYFVDSELHGDFLKVRVDGAVVFEISGPNQAGEKRIPVSSGNHTIRFEYHKNESVDYGLDTARVTNITARTGGSLIYESHNFAGRPLWRPPQAPGAFVPEWKSGGEGGGWVVSRVLPGRSYVPRQVVGESLAPGYQVFSEPVIDGDLSGNYKNSTQLRLPDFKDASNSGLLRMVTSENGDLFIGMQVPGSTSATLGKEKGLLTVLLDARREDTLTGQGWYAAAPGPEDRRFSIEYQSDGGQSSADIGLLQEMGDGYGGYDLVKEDEWDVEVAIVEHPSDLGVLHIELRINVHPASDAFSTGRLGLGLRHETATSQSLIRFPLRDDGLGPVDDDVLSWETLNLYAPAGRLELSEHRTDAWCCYPEPFKLTD